MVGRRLRRCRPPCRVVAVVEVVNRGSRPGGHGANNVRRSWRRVSRGYPCDCAPTISRLRRLLGWIGPARSGASSTRCAPSGTIERSATSRSPDLGMDADVRPGRWREASVPNSARMRDVPTGRVAGRGSPCSRSVASSRSLGVPADFATSASAGPRPSRHAALEREIAHAPAFFDRSAAGARDVPCPILPCRQELGPSPRRPTPRAPPARRGPGPRHPRGPPAPARAAHGTRAARGSARRGAQLHLGRSGSLPA